MKSLMEEKKGFAEPKLVIGTEPKVTVYISIGNSDDKLSQRMWSEFYLSLSAVIAVSVEQVHGKWVSESNSPWQNACWCVDLRKSSVDSLKNSLSKLAKDYRQDSIAWAEVSMTEFIGPA